MVGEGDIQTLLQLAQSLRRQPDDAVAGGHHFQRNLTQQLAKSTHQFIALQRKYLFNQRGIQRFADALLKGQPTAHHHLFAPALILNNHHVIIEYLGDFHLNPRNKKT